MAGRQRAPQRQAATSGEGRPRHRSLTEDEARALAALQARVRHARDRERAWAEKARAERTRRDDMFRALHRDAVSPSDMARVAGMNRVSVQRICTPSTPST